MSIKRFSTMVIEQKCGHTRAPLKPVDLTVYLLDYLSHKPELFRPAVTLYAEGGYDSVSPGED